MAQGDIHGDARVDPNAPRAFGVCDECGCWLNLHNLVKQDEWTGTAITWQGTLVCQRCYAKPQEQLRVIRLPPDPLPVRNPRLENFGTIDRPLGFTQYVMWAQGTPLDYVVVLTDGNGEPILDNYGHEIIIEIGADGPALLAQLSVMSGIPVPGTIELFNTTIAAANVSQQLIPAAATRSYIAIFNPCGDPIWVNVGAAASPTPWQGSITVGSGGCLFWATAQNLGVPTPLEITVYGNNPGTPVYAYAAP